MRRISSRILIGLVAAVALAMVLFRSVGASRDYELVPLESIPGVPAEVLAAQGKAVRISTPVAWFPEAGVALFEVTILDTQYFAEEREYAFTGDAGLLTNFVREVQFVQANSERMGRVKAGQVAQGVAEAIEGMVQSIWGVFRHPITTVKQLWGGGAGVVEYAKAAVQGKVSVTEDARDFAEAYYVDQCLTAAKQGGFDFLEAQTAEAIGLAQQMANARVAGGATAQILSLFAPTALLKATRGAEVVQLAAAARRTGEAAGAARALRTVGGGAEKLAAMAGAMANGEAAAASLARLARIAKAEQAVKGGTIVRSLIDPAKLATLQGRALNARLHRLLYHLHEAERTGSSVPKLLERAFRGAARAEGKGRYFDRAIDEQQILRTFEEAKGWGVFDEAGNLEKLRRGGAPVAVRGAFAGERLEVDHIIPVSRSVELSNRYGNLRYLPERLNRARGDRIDADALAKLQEYGRRGHFDQARIDAIVAAKPN